MTARPELCGTILVGPERKVAAGLLSGREFVTFPAWLRHHGGIEVVARDRADRRHLLRNLGEPLQGGVDRQHGVFATPHAPCPRRSRHQRSPGNISFPDA